MCLLEDRSGFLWAGTSDGLNRFDGYQFRVFRSQPDQENSLACNEITSLSEDRFGHIWIGTRSNGVSRFDPQTEQFKHFGNLGGSSQVAVYKVLASQTHLWVGTDVGLFSIDLERFDLTSYRSDPENPQTLSSDRVEDLVFDKAGRLWLLTSQGLNCFEDGKFKRFTGEWLDDRPLRKIDVNSAGEIWLATDQGLALYDPEEDQTKEFDLNLPEAQLAQPRIYCIYTDDDDTFWVMTKSGLGYLTKGSTSFRFFWAHEGDSFFPPSNHANCIMKNRLGHLWVGTTEGLFQRDPRHDQFGLLYRAPFKPHMMDVVSVLKDHRDVLWLGTFNMGLLYQKPESEMEKLDFGTLISRPLSRSRVNDLMEDENRHLWIGISRGGLVQLDPDRNLINHFYHDPKDGTSLSNSSIMRLFVDREKQMWVGTYGGLNRFIREENRFEHFLPQNDDPSSISHGVVQGIIQDQDGGYWIATQRGLNHSRDMSQFTKFFHKSGDIKSLSNNNIMDVALDREHRLWIGTAGGGINLFHPETGNFSHFNTAMGLPNDYIYRLLIDDLGRLWVSTNNGLSCFDPRTEVFTNYDRDDGVQGLEFNPVAFRDRDGRFYFGGLEGLNIFNPLEIKPKAPHARVTFTEFRMFNKPMEVKADTPLHNAIHLLPQLELSPDQDLFAVQFSNMGFSHSKKIRYAYKMENQDKEWLYADPSHRLATYSRLAGGHYRLRVKTSNQDGIWSPHEAILNIRAYPPFWKSKWAYILYALLTAGLIRLTFYLLRRDVALERAANLKLEAEVDQQTQALRERVVELETLDKIVQHINEDVTLQQVTSGILEHGVEWFPEADDAALMIFDQQREFFELVTHVGSGIEVPEGGVIQRQTIKDRFVRSDQFIATGLYLCIRGDGPAFPVVPLAKSLISMTLDYEGETMGVIVISSNDFEPCSVSDDEISRLSRFRAHVTTAFAKANTMNRLVETQQQLVETARHAGMAEIATAVLHNVGNILNSVITSSQMIRTSLEGSRLEGLQKAGEMVRESGLTPKVFFESDERASDLFRYLLSFEKPYLKEREKMVENANRVIKRVEDIRSVIMAQQSYAAMGFHLETLDLAAMINSSLSMMMSSIKSHQVRVEKDFQDVPKFYGERTKLIHIFVNLIKNAIEAMNHCPLDARFLRLKIYEDDTFIQVEVADQGEGISDENLDRIFQHGFTTKETGHGFGLHSVANSMSDFGGNIQVCKNSNVGVCFLLSFPKKPSEKLVRKSKMAGVN